MPAMGDDLSDSEEHMDMDLFAPGAVEALLARRRAVFGDAVMMADTGAGAEAETSGAVAAENAAGTTAVEERRDEPLGEAGMRALEREREDRKAAEKRARELQAKLDQATQETEQRAEEARRADMSDQERLVTERDDWRNKYQSLEASQATKDLAILRMQVAIEKGVPRHANRLVGTTREELEADADEFKSEITPAPERAKYVDPTRGGMSENAGRPRTPEEAAERYRASRARGSGTNPNH